MVALPDGSSIVVGKFDDYVIFNLGQPGQTEFFSNGSSGFFIARYDPQGSFLWARQAGVVGTNYDRWCSVSAFADHSAIVTGYFSNTVTFGSGEANQTVLLSPSPSRNIFIARFSPY